ncbi:MAG TPA: hypothetical protein VNI57_08670, partial [Candidatus Saccharimonadales bacterium]|nr:hypothetical protein [Candidatus Saccharimonadales bacterium]
LDVDAGGASSKTLMAGVASGAVGAVLALDEDLSTLPGGEAALKALGDKGSLAAIGSYRSPTTEGAAVRIPAAAYSEFEGTWVNFRGRAQRVRRGTTPRQAAPAVWQTLALILRELGENVSFESAAEILREVAANVPAFDGVTWTVLGGGGKQLAPGPGVPEPEPVPRSLPQPALEAAT